MTEYFEVELTDGQYLDFNKCCDRVLYEKENYVICGKTNGSITSCSILAIIPHKSIFKIIKRGI